MRGGLSGGRGRSPDLVAFGAVRRRSAIFVTVVLLGASSAARASIWPTAERRVERELGDQDVLVRRSAAQELSELPRASARRLASRALADTDADVRIAALRAAVAAGASDLGPRLASFLTDPDARVRLAAAEALSVRPSPAALAALARASSDTDAKVRATVARALGASESPEVVVPLLGRLDDPNPDVRRDVVNALGRVGDRRAVVPLLAKVEDSVSSVRRAAAHALGTLGDARAASALVLVLRDSDPAVRVAALEAVGRLGDPSTVSSVTDALKSEQPEVRAAAATALARLATPAALTALVAELGRPDADPESVVRALAVAGPAALPALRACVDAMSAPLSVPGCASALGAAGDASDTARIAGALGRGVLPPVVALPVLGKIGGSSAIPPALEALGSADETVRHAALAALLALLDPKHPDGRAVDPLLAAFHARGTRPAERALVVRLLGRTGAARVGPELTRIAAESTEPAMVAAAVNALGDLGAGPWESVVVAKLDDDDGEVRTAAALALRRSASEHTLNALLTRLERGAEQDRGALGLALPGAAAKSRDPRAAARMFALLARSRDDERDALIEAIAEAPGSAGVAATLAREPGADDRAKLAEALAGRADTLPTLIALAQDREPAVRANAAWSLGFDGGSAASELERLLADSDVRVAANAAVSLGRSAARARLDVRPLLCASASDSRAAVRASALTGLGLAGERCDVPSFARVLVSDPAPSVRRAAARLLANEPNAADAQALARCAADDESSEVAAACAARPSRVTAERAPVLVFVVPTGGDEPMPGVPFALRFADGTERLGAADRRGAVYERLAPAGALELGALPGASD